MQIIRAFSKKELALFFVSAIVALVSGLWLIVALVNATTKLIPAQGGSYAEGIVGQVAFINPILAREGSADRDVTTLVFADLMSLAESVKDSNGSKTWNVRLKERAVWQDGSPITSDDVIFTLHTIQNPDANSPLSGDWSNVSVSRISEREMQFQLASPYTLFPNMLRDLRPVPKRIFADISPANIRLSAFNLEPVGSGPFVYDQLEKRNDGFITRYDLVRNDKYESFAPKPFISKISLKFFENDDSLVKAYNVGSIDGFGTFDPDIRAKLKINDLTRSVPTFRYYAVFLNQNANPALAYREVRDVLARSIDRARLVQDVYKGNADAMPGPIPPALDASGGASPMPIASPDDLKAELSDAGWSFSPASNAWERKAGNGTLKLAFSIKVPDLPLLVATARFAQDAWSAVGIKADIDAIDPQSFGESVLRSRDYEAILYGNILLSSPDLFSFWSSSEKFYPGLNFSLYGSKEADSIIASLKSVPLDSAQRSDKLEQLAARITADRPAVFLVSPHYMYVTKRPLAGITISPLSVPEDRFRSVDSWYVSTRRVLK